MTPVFHVYTLSIYFSVYILSYNIKKSKEKQGQIKNKAHGSRGRALCFLFYIYLYLTSSCRLLLISSLESLTSSGPAIAGEVKHGVSMLYLVYCVIMAVLVFLYMQIQPFLLFSLRSRAAGGETGENKRELSDRDTSAAPEADPLSPMRRSALLFFSFSSSVLCKKIRQYLPISYQHPHPQNAILQATNYPFRRGSKDYTTDVTKSADIRADALLTFRIRDDIISITNISARGTAG